MNSANQDLMRANVLKLLERMKSQGTPVHALGMQTHLWYDTDFNPKTLQTFLRNVADLGLKILITEMDVTDTALPGDIAVRDRKVAGLYEDILSVVLNEPAVIGATHGESATSIRGSRGLHREAMVCQYAHYYAILICSVN